MLEATLFHSMYRNILIYVVCDFYNRNREKHSLLLMLLFKVLFQNIVKTSKRQILVVLAGQKILQFLRMVLIVIVLSFV